jgi:NAD(P)-dependent dehydrogenase (short-subunit alcohol dehydrogenase family)
MEGQVVLVTGAGRGIGAGIAARFAEAGANVVVHYRTSEDGAKAVVRSIRERGGEAVALQADLVEKDQVEDMVDRALEIFDKIDVLVNNAGTYPLSSLLEMEEAEWDLVIDANLRSCFLCTQAVARIAVAQGHRCAIVNIGSPEGRRPARNHSHYNAAKAGVLMYTRASALELGPHGIRVNAVSPGLIWREGIEEEWPEGVDRYRENAPLARIGRPEDVADACLFLASRAARWITGINLVVDGGMLMSAGG